MLLIILTYLLYIALLFFIVANFNYNILVKYIVKVVPASLTCFTTMSSLITIALTINAAKKNTVAFDISRLVISATANIHMVGLVINIPLMALSILTSFGYALPTLAGYSNFTFYFVLAQFAIAGALGFGILVMIHLLEKYLGFTGEMSALITTLYILFDSAETSANVLVTLVSKI